MKIMSLMIGLLIWWPPTPAGEARSFALVVGIDKYPSAEQGNLKAAVGDSQQLVDLLRQTYAFPAAQITHLTDGAATKA